MKSLVSLTVLAIASAAFSQTPPPGMPVQMPPQNSPNGRNQNSAQSQKSTSSSATVPTETIRVLGLSSVEQDLAITSEEYTSLSQLASTVPAASTSEDQAFTAVSKVLTTAQTARLEELMIQDLGYGAVSLSDVRTKLGLTADQTTQVDCLLASLETAKKAILQLNSNAAASEKAISQVASSTDLSLEAALTADQRTKLHTMAGKPLATQN